MDDTRLSQLEKSIEEIKESQQKIATALLGSYEKNSVGLIEESRNLRRDVECLVKNQAIQQTQLTEVLEFKADAKKIVAGIAIIVPFVFELLKIVLSGAWEMLKGK